MAVDLEEIEKAIARVKDRSFAPGVVDHLAELLADARRELLRLPAEVSNLQSALDGAREQAASVQASADRDVAAARAALDAARALDASHEETIVIAHALGQVLAEVDALKADRDALVEACVQAKATARTVGVEARAEAALLTAERDAVIARDASKQAALDEIAALPWWKAHIAKRIAHAEPRS